MQRGDRALHEHDGTQYASIRQLCTFLRIQNSAAGAAGELNGESPASID